MNRTRLSDNTEIYCLHQREALVLDAHCEGYLCHGITVSPGDVVFDIGTNIGLFALRMNQRNQGELTVLAFEPIPDIHAVAHANLAAFEGTTLFNAGVSAATGQARFTYYPNTPSLSTAHPEMWNEEAGELAEAVVGNAHHGPMWYGKLLPRWLAGFIAKRLRSDAITVECPLMTVSEVIQEQGLTKIDLLKVDCEGAELDVLKGISQTDWPKVRQAVLEVHDVDGQLEAVTRLLVDHGLTELVTEQEPAFKHTRLWNVFARRPQAP